MCQVLAIPSTAKIMNIGQAVCNRTGCRSQAPVGLPLLHDPWVSVSLSMTSSQNFTHGLKEKRYLRDHISSLWDPCWTEERDVELETGHLCMTSWLWYCWIEAQS